MIEMSDIAHEGSDWEIDLGKLVNKRVKTVTGSIGEYRGEIAFQLFKIIFEDDTFVFVEGLYDFPYISKPRPQAIANLDDETLRALLPAEDEE